MSVCGTVTAPKGIKVTKVQVLIAGKTFAAQITQPGNKFCVNPLIDTAQFKDGAQTVSVQATGSLDAAGSSDVPVLFDNTAPVAQIVAPADGSVAIGKIAVQVKVADKNFKSATLQWGLYLEDGSDPEEWNDLLPTGGAAMTKPGTYDFMLDRSADATAAVQIRLTANDAAQNAAAQASVRVQIVKQPRFLGNSGDADTFQHEIKDMQMADMDGDGIVDAVIATSAGVALRRGIAALDEEGNPSAAGTGRFEAVKDPVADTVTTTGKLIPGGNMGHVLLTDLDGDGDPDVIATGIVNDLPTAWALLNIQRTVTAKNGTQSVEHVLKLVDSAKLPELALSAALGDLNGDGLPDLITGAEGDKGLTTWLLIKDPLCSVAAETIPCSGADVATGSDPAPMTKVSKAAIFTKQSYSAVNYGVTEISSIAVADFYADDLKALDICVGEKSRPVVSCYRNVKQDGTLEQAQDSYTMTDAGDVRLILGTKWNSKTTADTPDLVVASSKGILRWLRGDHAGRFSYSPGEDREILGFEVTGMEQAPIGPGGTPYLLIVEAGRVGTVVPLMLDDESYKKICFRSWILGGSVSKVTFSDLNNDQLLDIVSLDSAPSGLPVALGLADGDFLAPSVHHLCALRPSAGMGVFDIAAMAFADFNADKKADLLLVGKRSWSLQPGISGSCPGDAGTSQPKWAWALHLFSNGTTADVPRLNPVPRAAEFAPNAVGQTALSGASTDCGGGGVPKSFGTVSGMAVADMDGDGALDLVMVRDESDYAMGTASTTAAGTCPKNCEWKEGREVDNTFGTDYPASGKDTLCCKNYAAQDKDKTKPLFGYGGATAAPLDRASAFVFINGAKAATPFDFDNNGTPLAPKVIKPAWSMAAGINPIGVVAEDFNKDGKTDIVTVMKEKGADNDKDKHYLESRIRVFKGKQGANRWDYFAQPAGDAWPWKNPLSGAVEDNVDVTYRIVGRGPIAVASAPLGLAGRPGVYTLGSTMNNFTFLESLGTMDFKLGTHFAVGPGVTSFVVRDVNPSQDNAWSDVVYVLKDAIGVLLGNQVGDAPSFNAGGHLVEGTTSVNFVDTVDANQDGFLDLTMINTSSWTVQFFLGDGKGSFVKYDGELRVLPGAKRILQGNLVAPDASKPKCFDLAVQSDLGATVLRNLDCN